MMKSYTKPSKYQKSIKKGFLDDFYVEIFD